ncbi:MULTISPECIES: hypothetical protein [Cryobacterium]|uniref:Uncharacterized protein n=1 Tax=Cryobacterium breve TaxID=1259258 RepID=A0ABY2J4D1_9MICO|nr:MULTISPECIES: hypothetical protein [Cryobacterium]TFC92074.1 hypothetical protein E3T20_12225 [Cryobacterium sp. TmT3-12]TFC99787.1 hypothetical protein E3O65_05280 [Cryobacterium breve]
MLNIKTAAMLAARFALTLFRLIGRLLTPERVARLVIILFVLGCLWVFTGAAFLWSIPFTLFGLVLCVPAVIVVSLPKGNTP